MSVRSYLLVYLRQRIYMETSDSEPEDQGRRKGKAKVEDNEVARFRDKGMCVINLNLISSL